MSHIYWELKEIPIPGEAYINTSDGRVFLMNADGSGKKKRRVIGHAATMETMHPNDLFKYLYPGLWAEYYGDRKLPEHELHIGMYALSLGVGCSKGLYPILQDVYGPLYGNAIMDYAMYSIMDRTNTAQLFPDRMSREVLFSKEAWSDDWYSALFRQHMPEDANHLFRMKWLEECHRMGITKAWISIDGSNNDCEVKRSDLCEKGEAKSHTNSDLVSYIWALDTRAGIPITYFVNNGGMVDSKAFQKVAAFLKGGGIDVEGVILDRGFCTYDVFLMLEQCSYPYVVMLKSDTYGHMQMMERHASEIRWSVRHVINDNGLFGISEEQKIFGHHPEKAWVSLYFDGVNGTGRSITLIKKIRSAARTMNESILNHEKPSVPKELSPYLSVIKNGRSWKVEYNYDAWQRSLDEKGFCSIASSDNFGPGAVDRLYHLRDVSEKQYMIMKSQLGFDTTRTHSTEGIEARFAACFTAAILRSVIKGACRKNGLDTNQMLREMDRVSLVLLPDGLYSYVNNLSVRQRTLLEACGIQPSCFKAFADDVNRRRKNPINSQIHRLPESGQDVKKKRGRPPKKKLEDEPVKIKRKPGRPKGSKNKKTLEKEALALQQSIPQPEKRKPGRPKGSKNKPKITTPEPAVKRRRGRPPKDSNNSN